MLFPKIPNIDLKSDIKLEDALSLLLNSIALEETSLSKLLDAETEKVLYAIDECKLEKFSVQDVKDINKSVNQTVANIIKLQMLLQSKTESIIELLPTKISTTSTTTTTTSTTTTTTTTKSASTTKTHTTTCTTSQSTTITRKKCECSLIGKGKGYISNRSDNLYHKTAFLQAYIRKDSCIDQRMLTYTVKNNIKMIADASSIDIKCPSALVRDSLVVSGSGLIKKSIKSHPDITVTSSFILKIWINEVGTTYFQIEIKSTEMPELNHDSGLVNTISSDLIII